MVLVVLASNRPGNQIPTKLSTRSTGLNPQKRSPTQASHFAVQTEMALDPDKLQKPPRELRKLLKKISKQPSLKQVHDLRTNTRRLEALMEALMLDQKRKGVRILRAMAPIRKQAGKVRDMDVLVGFASTVASEGETECLVQLIEYLSARRLKSARKLGKIIAEERRETLPRLKSCGTRIRKGFNSKRTAAAKPEWRADATATAIELSRELTAWPALDKTNLHPFRLKVKELRYVLQFSGKDQDEEFTEMLGEVKDAIGKWHDWTELSAIAAKTIEHGPGCHLLKEIRSKATEHFDHALSLSNAMRKKYLDGNPHRAGRPAPVKLPQPVLTAAARLA